MTDPTDLCTLRQLETEHIARVLRATHGNQRRAAHILGVTRWALARRLRKLGLRVGDVSSPGSPASPAPQA